MQKDYTELSQPDKSLHYHLAPADDRKPGLDQNSFNFFYTDGKMKKKISGIGWQELTFHEMTSTFLVNDNYIDTNRSHKHKQTWPMHIFTNI